MELSIIAVVINNYDSTQRFVSSIRSHTQGRYELIIVDNASTDKKTRAYIKKEADVYVRFNTRVDLTVAWNTGIRASKGTYVVVANNDVVVPPNWFMPLRELFIKRRRTGMVYPLTYWTLNRCLKMGWIKNLKSPIRIPRWRQGVWGEFNVFTRKVLDDVGLYSEIYPGASAEDVDMLYKLHEKNYSVYIQPRVFVFHEGGATGKTLDKRELDQMYARNWRVFLKKWGAYKDYIFDRVP